MPRKATISAPKVMDVAHPSRVKVNATTVPLIVTNRPILKDPMMADAVPTPDQKSPAEKAKSAPIIKKIELQPLAGETDVTNVAVKTQAPKETPEPAAAEGQAASLAANEPAPGSPELKLPDATPTDTTDKAAEPEAPLAEKAEDLAPTKEAAEAPAEEPKEAETEEVPKVEPEQKPPEEPKPDEEEVADTPPAEEASEDLLGGAKSAQDPAAAKAAREAAEKQLALDKLISEGTYVLPVNTVEKRRVRIMVLVVLLVVVVMGIAGFMLALDAGYLHIDGLSAPTNFIK